MSVSIFDFFLALVPLVQLLTEIGMSGVVALLIDSLRDLGVSSIHQVSWQAELVLSVV